MAPSTSIRTSNPNAVAAARAKAELYCEAAGVDLGAIQTIEDVDPRRVIGAGEGRSLASAEMNTARALDPASIVVTAAVQLTFALV